MAVMPLLIIAATLDSNIASLFFEPVEFVGDRITSWSIMQFPPIRHSGLDFADLDRALSISGVLLLIYFGTIFVVVWTIAFRLVERFLNFGEMQK